jgi:hypothetical protein
MHVNGYLDENKEQMLKDIDEYLLLSKEQKQAFSLLKRGSYGALPIDAVRNEDTMKRIRPELERIEKTEKGGIDGYLNRLLSRLA